MAVIVKRRTPALNTTALCGKLVSTPCMDYVKEQIQLLYHKITAERQQINIQIIQAYTIIKRSDDKRTIKQYWILPQIRAGTNGEGALPLQKLDAYIKRIRLHLNPHFTCVFHIEHYLQYGDDYYDSFDWTHVTHVDKWLITQNSNGTICMTEHEKWG
jgi:hypothetical protein